MSQPPRHLAGAARQSGFTLIELMIAITMALFLIAGVLGLVISMSRSFRTEDQLTQTQETERFMLSVLNNTIHPAGYFVDPVGTPVATALPASTVATADGTPYAAAQSISGTGSGSGTGAASDTINVRFQSAAGDGLMNCQGDTNTTAGTVVWSSSFAVNAQNQLTCAVSTNGAAPPAGTPLVLVDNVYKLKAMYCVDTDADGNADTYLTAAQVTTAGLWSSVVSVQLTITLVDLINNTAANPKYLTPLVQTINLMNKS